MALLIFLVIGKFLAQYKNISQGVQTDTIAEMEKVSDHNGNKKCGHYKVGNLHCQRACFHQLPNALLL